LELHTLRLLSARYDAFNSHYAAGVKLIKHPPTLLKQRKTVRCADAMMVTLSRNVT